MTNRENQILEWIRENPLISQEELARKAGIARSSVAVHISSLMKQGLIAGKGYVLTPAHYAAVIGAVNVDIGGQPFAPLIAADSNPGTVRVSLGGVGHNIARNLAHLGTKVRFLTAIGDDVYARQVEASCSRLEIDLSMALKLNQHPTSTYLYISDENGDMQLAIADMAATQQLTPDYLKANLEMLNQAGAVAADANLSEESLHFLAENCTAPLFVDTVSVTKARKLKSVLGCIHTLKPNRLEAECLSGVEITDEYSLHRAAGVLLHAGVKRVLITLGADGALVADGDGMRRVPAVHVKVKNATGAGDAMMAALVHAHMQGRSLDESAAFAAAAAAIAMESEETINEVLCEELVCERLSPRH